MARSYGALGIDVTRSDQFEDALRTALACGRPALIAVRTSLEHISAAAIIDELRIRRVAVLHKD